MNLSYSYQLLWRVHCHSLISQLDSVSCEQMKMDTEFELPNVNIYNTRALSLIQDITYDAQRLQVSDNA